MSKPTLGETHPHTGLCGYGGADLNDECPRPAAYRIFWAGEEGASSACEAHAMFARTAYGAAIEAIFSIGGRTP